MVRSVSTAKVTARVPGVPMKSIRNNTSKDEATMINCPIGEDLWKNADVDIKENVSENKSMMINYPMTFDVLEKMLQFQSLKLGGGQAFNTIQMPDRGRLPAPSD